MPPVGLGPVDPVMGGDPTDCPHAAGGGVAGSTGEYLLWLSLATPDNSGPSIGPDNFGYMARAVDFGFEDISSFGITGLSYGDDRYFTITTGNLPGFDYDFYGRDQGNFYVSSNGLVTFGGGYTYWSNSNLTNSPTYSAIVPFWDDLVVDSGGSVYWTLRGTGSQQRLIIQWDDVRFYGQSGGGSDNVTFQAILYEVDNSIRFNYMDLDAGNYHSGGARGRSSAKSPAAGGVRSAGSRAKRRGATSATLNSWSFALRHGPLLSQLATTSEGISSSKASVADSSRYDALAPKSDAAGQGDEGGEDYTMHRLVGGAVETAASADLGENTAADDGLAAAGQSSAQACGPQIGWAGDDLGGIDRLFEEQVVDVLGEAQVVLAVL